MRFSNVSEEEGSKPLSDASSNDQSKLETQLVSMISETRQSAEQPPSLIMKRQCKLKSLLVLGGVELFNTGPDFAVFLPTLVAFIVVLNAISIFVRTTQVNSVVKDAVLWVNITQNMAYLLTGLVNPGVARSNERETSTTEELFLCRPCNIYTRPKTRHCTYCSACIKGYDHHCPWVGKCIGRGNILLFFLFLISTMGAIMVSMISLMLAIMSP